jgi:hypothetical protein
MDSMTLLLARLHHFIHDLCPQPCALCKQTLLALASAGFLITETQFTQYAEVAP